MEYLIWNRKERIWLIDFGNSTGAFGKNDQSFWVRIKWWRLLLYILRENIVKAVDDGKLEEAKKYLRQSYAMAILTKQNEHAEVTKNIYKDYFGEDIYGLVQSLKVAYSGLSPYNSIWES